MSKIDQLAIALTRALVHDSDAVSQRFSDYAEGLASSMSLEEVEKAKSIAIKLTGMGE
tara:strand:+ start:106 stop:279 length:174 start_codon:yes stop_codon:yes gene_type:complete